MVGSKIYSEYIIKNEFNELYVTEAQMHSEIEQTAEGINREVSKKVGENEIISKINQSAEKILISGDKIDINGKAVNFSTEINEDIGEFVQEDKDRIKKIIMGEITPTSQDYEKYDINKDGSIDTADLALVVRAINNNGYLNMKGTFIINPYSATETIKIYDREHNKVMAVLSMFANFLQTIISHKIDIPNQNGITAQYSNYMNIQQEGTNNFIDARVGNWYNGKSTSGIRVSNGANIDVIAQENMAFIHLYKDNQSTEISNVGITTPTLTQTSKRESKKNISKLKNALDIIKNVDIYKYNLKKEKKGTKKHIGFVIGDKYNYSEELTNNNNTGAEIYSLASTCLAGIKEQQVIIEKLTKRIEKLEAKVNE